MLVAPAHAEPIALTRSTPDLRKKSVARTLEAQPRAPPGSESGSPTGLPTRRVSSDATPGPRPSHGPMTTARASRNRVDSRSRSPSQATRSGSSCRAARSTSGMSSSSVRRSASTATGSKRNPRSQRPRLLAPRFGESPRVPPAAHHVDHRDDSWPDFLEIQNGMISARSRSKQARTRSPPRQSRRSPKSRWRR